MENVNDTAKVTDGKLQENEETDIDSQMAQTVQLTHTR